MRATKYRMAQADEALLRLCRLCVSIKMHTQGMSVEDGAKFFRDNCYYEDKPAHSEAMRGTFDPGYLNYTLGKLQILKLRADYKAQEGASFSLEKFHDEMLHHWHAAHSPPARDHAQEQEQVGRSAVGDRRGRGTHRCNFYLDWRQAQCRLQRWHVRQFLFADGCA